MRSFNLKNLNPIEFARREPVLAISAALTIVSMFFVFPDATYASYVDWRVLIMLFCLMATVAGLQSSGALTRAASYLVGSDHAKSQTNERGERPSWLLFTILVMLPFFAAMLITNDVALLAFVAVAIIALQKANMPRALAPIVVLQTIAANLGGMLTPMGNPQNLFIYLHYNVSPTQFLLVITPYVVVSGALLVVASIGFGLRPRTIAKETHKALGKQTVPTIALDKKRCVLHCMLFAICILAVLRIISDLVLLAIILVTLLAFDRAALRKVDYGLLATFVCFFIFSGNMARIPELSSFVSGFMQYDPFITSLLLSQVISNVPSAVLLADFTTNWQALLLGVDIGGLGTPVASLASLISLRLFMHAQPSDTLRFFHYFAIFNIAFLAILLGLRFIIG